MSERDFRWLYDRLVKLNLSEEEIYQVMTERVKDNIADELVREKLEVLKRK